MANDFFNAEYYLQQNADVAEAVGTNLELAEQHYLLHGAFEADEGTNTARKPAPWFDIEFYRASNEKLADVPADQLFLHFTLHGMREGLSPMEGVSLDAQAYADANPELVTALGIENAEDLSEDDILLLNQHFYAHGYRGGYEGGPEIPGWNGDSDLSELADALAALQTANQDIVDFLASAPALESTNVDVDAGEATADDIRAYQTDIEVEVGAAVANPGFADLSDAAQDETIAARESLLAAQVSVAKAGLPANLESQLASAETARENLVAALKASNAAAKEESAQLAAFSAYHGANAVVVDDLDDDYDSAADNSGVLFVYEGKIYAGQNGTTTPVEFDDLDEADASVPFVTELSAALSAADSAAAAAVTAESILEAAVGKVYVSVNKAYAVVPGEDFSGVITAVTTEGSEAVTVNYDSPIDLYATRADATATPPEVTSATAAAAGDLAEALDAQESFAQLVANFQQARDLNGDLTDLENAAADARAAIENPVDDEDEPGLGITLVDLEPAVVAIADIEEVFLFNAETAGDITGFGAEDLLFFGSEYTFVELAEGVDFAKSREGSADALEIFYQVQGANTFFYVEDEAEAGRDLNLDNITIVQLTGVAGELDIAQDLGFVSLA